MSSSKRRSKRRNRRPNLTKPDSLPNGAKLDSSSETLDLNRLSFEIECPQCAKPWCISGKASSQSQKKGLFDSPCKCPHCGLEIHLQVELEPPKTTDVEVVCKQPNFLRLDHYTSTRFTDRIGNPFPFPL